MPRERIVTAESQGEEETKFNYALRPQNFEQYIGQETLVRKLRIAVRAAQSRGGNRRTWPHIVAGVN